MLNKVSILWLFFASTIISSAFSLSCYQCQDENECFDPIDKSLVKSSSCNPQDSNQCVVHEYNDKFGSRHIFRGCIHTASTDFCTLQNNLHQIQKNTLIKCETCEKDDCNGALQLTTISLTFLFALSSAIALFFK